MHHSLSQSSPVPWRQVLLLLACLARSPQSKIVTNALQLHTTLTFSGLRVRATSSRQVTSSRIPGWLLPQPVIISSPRTRQMTNLSGSESHYDEPDPQDYHVVHNDDYPFEFLEELKENNMMEAKRLRNTQQIQDTIPRAIDETAWFEGTLQEIKDRYEGIRTKVKAELAQSREADPDSVPDTVDGMVDTVLRQEMETVIKSTKSEMEMDRYRKMEINKLNFVENIDLKQLGQDETVTRLIQESNDDLDRKSRTKAEIDDFMKYQEERLANATGQFNDASSIAKPTDDLDSWALERMEDMLSKDANNVVLKASVGDLRSRIKLAKNDKSFKPDSYGEWQMYRSISQNMKNRTDGTPSIGDDDVREQLKSWKEYLAEEQIYRQEVGLTPKLKMPFSWNEVNQQTPSFEQPKSDVEEKIDPDAFRAEINREAVKVMESLLEKRRGSTGSEALAKRVALLKDTLESTNYVDRIVTKKGKSSSGPVDISDVFASISKPKVTTKVTKKRDKEEFSKFLMPARKKNRKGGVESDARKTERRQPEIIDDFVDDFEDVFVPSEPEIDDDPTPVTKRPNSIFFNSPDSNESDFDKVSPAPKTPFFEEQDRSDEKLGTIKEQKLRNMYRKAGAATEEEQDNIRKGWEEFQAYEAAQRDLSGFSDNDFSDNLTASVDLGYNISDVVTADGDIDAEKIIAVIRARRPKPFASSEGIGGSSKETEMLKVESVSNESNEVPRDITIPVSPSLSLLENKQHTGALPLSFVSSQDDEDETRTTVEFHLAHTQEQVESSAFLSRDQLADEQKIEGSESTSKEFLNRPQSESTFQENSKTEKDGVGRFSKAKFFQSPSFKESLKENELLESVDSEIITNPFPLEDLDFAENSKELVQTFQQQSTSANSGSFAGNTPVESATLSMEDFGIQTQTPSVKVTQEEKEESDGGSRFAKRSFDKRSKNENKQVEYIETGRHTSAPSGRALGGFLGDEAFDDVPTSQRSHDDIQRRTVEFERLRAIQDKRRMGIDLLDVLGSRPRDEDYKVTINEEYVFPVRNTTADLSTFQTRKAILMDRPLLNVVDVNNLMDLKDSLEGDGLSRYVPQISKPFREFGAIVRLEGVLVDITGLQLKAWNMVAAQHKLEPPLLEEVRLASITKPEVAIERVFYWSNDLVFCREAAETHAKAIREIVSEWVRTQKNDDVPPTSTPLIKSKSAQSIGDDMLNPIGAMPRKETLTDSDMQIIHHQAWSEVAIERGLKLPSFEDVVSAMAINNPALIIREWFKWSSESFVIEEIAQAYREIVLRAVSEKTGMEFDLPKIKKKRRGFLPAMVDPSAWRNGDQETVEEVERHAKKVELIKAAKDAWFVLARKRGFSKPDNSLVSQAMKVGPDDAVMAVFGWTESTREKNELVRLYYEIFNKKVEKRKARDVHVFASKDDDMDIPLVQIIPGSVQWVTSLVDVQMSCGILSLLERDVSDLILEHSGLSNLISRDKRITASDMYTRDDQLMLGAAIRLERKPDHCIIFDSTSATFQAARELEMKSVGMTGIHPTYELVAADTTARGFDSLSAANIRRLFAERENQEPMLLSEAIKPIKRRKVKTRFVDQDDREWDSDEYYEKYGNYGEGGLGSETRQNSNNLEDAFQSDKAIDDNESVTFDDEFKGWLFQ